MRLGVNKYEKGPGKRTSQGKRKKCKKASMTVDQREWQPAGSECRVFTNSR